MIGRLLRITIGTLLLLVIAAAGGGYLWLRLSLPQVDGTIQVNGSEALIEIVRDAGAVPHIRAGSIADAYFGLGFVHAQDRLWQMEFRRRIGAGRLAELVGDAALPTDRFMRIMGFYRLAEASLEFLDDETVTLLEAYAAGVNAFINENRWPLPPEFLVFGAEPEPWRPADSLVWLRLMALDLGGNWRTELLRSRLARHLDTEQMADLWPGSPAGAPITLDDTMAWLDGLDLDGLVAALPPAPPPGLGSNAWVLAGSRTSSGAPLLANDPHLGLRAPGIWYLAHLEAPGLGVIGTTMPGVPVVVLGRNRSIAWGFTNTGPDTQDLFIERVDPDDPARYLTPTGSAPFDIRQETIRIKDGPPVTLMVRKTRHGPVITDMDPAIGDGLASDQVLALAWTALEVDERTIEAGFRLARATDWASFTDALRSYGSPQQNIMYADRRGSIGFYAPGHVPIRASGDGRIPVPGWDGSHDWIGRIPFDELPHDRDPAGGMLINANNRVVDDSYPHFITADWGNSLRARRIGELLQEVRQGLDESREVQLDIGSGLVRDFLPLMLKSPALSPEAGAMMARLAAWDGRMDADAAEPLLFAAWYGKLAETIYADELGELFDAYAGIRSDFTRLALTERTIWCDDVGTKGTVETCPERIGLALKLALVQLGELYGSTFSSWRWGNAHPARMAHSVLGDQPLLGWLVNIELASDGDSSTINVGRYLGRGGKRPFVSTHAASYRALMTMAEPDRSRFIAATGQSGHPLSPHYRDLADLWAAGRYLPMSMSRRDYEPGALGTLRLAPDR